jgi:iron(III) transport system permease protein
VQRTHRPAGNRVATGAALVAIAGLVVVPMARLCQVVVDDRGAVDRVLRAPGLSSALQHTVVLACVVPAVSVPLGAAMAIYLRRPDVPFRTALRIGVLLPLIVPQFVLGYSWTQAYGRAGFTDTLVGVRWNGLLGPAGVTAVMIVDAVPLAYLLTTVGVVTRAQPDLDRAARVCGANGWTTLRTVKLPLLRPVLAAGVVLTFVATLENFAVPQVLGVPAGYSTLTTRIYADLSLGSDPASFVDAVTLALGLVLIAAVVLLPADVLLGPQLRTVRTALPTGAGSAIPATRRARGPAAVLTGYLLLVVGVPTAALVLAAVTRAVGVPPTPSNWTLGNFRAALDGPTMAALGHSLELAALAACFLTVLGALLCAVERTHAGRAFGTAAIATFAIPGSTLAVGLLIAYGRWFDGGLALILVAYLAKFWALAHRMLSGAIDRLPPAELQAARCSGARPITVIRTIWLPALAPALIGAWVIVFVAALHEVTMSSLLYGPTSQTFAVAVLNSQELGDIGSTAALSVVLTGLLLVAAFPALIGLRVAALRRDARATRRPVEAQAMVALSVQ